MCLLPFPHCDFMWLKLAQVLCCCELLEATALLCAENSTQLFLLSSCFQVWRPLLEKVRMMDLLLIPRLNIGKLYIIYVIYNI